MKFVTAGILASLVALSACVKQEYFVKQNITYDRYERDYVGCLTQATQAVPTNTQVGWIPYGGVYSYDTNTQLRTQSFEICMRDHGYSKVPLNYCEGENLTAAKALAKAQQARSRKLQITSATCYFLPVGGTPYIYTPDA